MMIFYFIVCFTFSASCLELSFHLRLPVSVSLSSIVIFQALSSVIEKCLYTQIHKQYYNIYFRKLLHFCLAKKFDIWIPPV